jgi:hypothetical protein
VLTDGGFTLEAVDPMREAVEAALQALVDWRGHSSGATPALGLIDSTLVQTKLLTAEHLSHIARLRDEHSELDEARAGNLLAQGDKIFAQAQRLLESAQGNL